MDHPLGLGEPPVVGYTSNERFKLDLRTVFPRQDEQLLRAIRAALESNEFAPHAGAEGAR